MKKIDKEKKLTVLGKETVFDGFLKFSEDLHIQGTFSGAIDAQGFLLIEKGAVCKTQYIRAASIVIEGTVYGSLMAADKIVMKVGSVVHGDVHAARI
ncbi:polymer-forming cytoskeletal protein, partial [uncultured Treponema sp.]|uniref:bactofilin family protein n=1 Tax=uncultured Treponema sp. TaxID=162155 RepID=UPI0028E85915